jgi:hypothetical protein
MSRYLIGADVLGASDQYVAIRLKDVGGLVRQQGGRSGGLAYSLAPQTITHVAYEKMKNKLAEGFAQQGVIADVSVETSPSSPVAPTEFFRGAIIGAAGVGAGWVLWKYVIKGLISKRRK